MKRSVRIWLRGLIAAIISGGAGGIGSAFSDVVFSSELTPSVMLQKALFGAGVAAAVGVSAYLRQSPLPERVNHAPPPVAQ